MGIRQFRFIKDDNISEVKESIEKFMEIKIAGKITPSQWTKVMDIDSTLLPNSYTTETTRELVVFPPTAKKINIKNSAGVTPRVYKIPIHEESEADMLVFKKKESPQRVQEKGIESRQQPQNHDDGDILSDGTPRKGFNTGIRQTKKKQ